MPGPLVLPVVAVLSVVADQLTKHFVTATLSPGESVVLAPWLEPVLHVTYVRNSGAAFGLFPRGSHVFIIIAVVVIAALIWYYTQLQDGNLVVHLALGLQLGGATGNLIDRIRFQGHVIDFVDLNFWPLRTWPVFNVADASIVTGVVVLTLLMIWEGWQEEGSRTSLTPLADD